MNAISAPSAAEAIAATAVSVQPRAHAPHLHAGLRSLLALAGLVLPPLLLLLALMGLWELAASGPAATLPSPSRVWVEAGELITDPFFDRGGLDKGLGLHLLASLQRVALGFTLAAAAGVVLGMLVGSSRLALCALDPLFQVLRTVPPLAWLPLSLAAFREAQPSAIFVIFITAVWPVVINTAVGVRNVPVDYRNVARVLGFSPLDWFLRIVVPAASPYIFTGLRIGVGLSWLAIIAAEMLVGGVGIGFFVWDAWNSSNLSDIVVALVYIGLVGFALDRAMALLGRAVTRGTTEQ
jgi:nitrate/nitrite transport system permease protein